jgi:hypothetical protein
MLNDMSIIENCRVIGSPTIFNTGIGDAGMLRIVNGAAINNIVYPVAFMGVGIAARGDSYVTRNFVKNCQNGIAASSGGTGAPFVGNSSMGTIVLGNAVFNCTIAGIWGHGNTNFYWAGRINNNVVDNCVTGVSCSKHYSATRFFISNNAISNATTGILNTNDSAAAYTIHGNNTFNCSTAISSNAPGIVQNNTTLDPQLTVSSESVAIGNSNIVNMLNSFPTSSGGGGGTRQVNIRGGADQ